MKKIVEKNEKLKKKKISGVTLIALIVTIIIVLILASVSASVFSNSNIIKKSKFAGETYQNKINEEEKAMQNYVSTMNKYTIADTGRDETITINKNEYSTLKSDVETLKKEVATLKENKVEILDCKSIPKTVVNMSNKETKQIYSYTVTKDGILNAFCSFDTHNETSTYNLEAQIYINGNNYSWDGSKGDNAMWKMTNSSCVAKVKKGDVVVFQVYAENSGTYYYSYGYSLIGNNS